MSTLKSIPNYNQSPILPNDMLINPELNYGGVIARTQTYILPSTGAGNYGPQGKIQFTFPNEMMDFKNSTFQFTLNGTAGGGATYTRINQGIKSIINRITVQAGSKTILDINNYNQVSLLNDLSKDFNLQSTSLKVAMGYGTPTERNNYFASSTKVYAVQLYSLHEEFWHAIMPYNMTKVQLVMNIYLEEANKCIESDGTNPTFTINNCEYHYSSLVPSDGWVNMFNQRLSSVDNFPTYSYNSYDVIEDQSLCQVGVSNISKVLTFKYSQLSGIGIIFRNLAGIDSFATNNKLNNFVYPAITNRQLKIGGISFPNDQQSSNPDEFSMLCEYYDTSMQRVPLGFAVNYDGTGVAPSTYGLFFPLAKFPYQEEDDGIKSQGLSTDIGTNIVLSISFSAPLPSALVMTVFARYNNTIIYNSNGTVSWYT